MLRFLGLSGLAQIANLHPAVVHFPVALVPLTLILFIVGHFTDRAGVRLAARLCLWLAFAAVWVAVFTGSKAVNNLPRDTATWAVFRVHRSRAFLCLGVTIAATSWSMAHVAHRPRAFRTFLVLLALDCLLVFQTADAGARLVYNRGAAVSPMAPK